MKKTDTLALTEAGIMVALSAVLSLMKVIELPYGGSVTFASMLPILIFSYRHGVKYGMGAALTASVVQLLLGLKNFSYFTTWYSILVLALLDYIVAFAVFGLSGALKNRLAYRTSLTVSAIGASVLRYVCHVISGATIWAGLSIPTEAALIYSLGYNATYMVPETIILVAAVVYLTSALDFGKAVPTRAPSQALDSTGVLIKALAGLSLLFAVIFDTVTVFEELQDPESGDFVIQNLAAVNWWAVAIVTVIAVFIFTALLIVERKRAKAE